MEWTEHRKQTTLVLRLIPVRPKRRQLGVAKKREICSRYKSVATEKQNQIFQTRSPSPQVYCLETSGIQAETVR